MDPFLGEIRIFGGNFAPVNWALCSGQILGIAQYTALFSLLGTNYGGNGTTTFGLPNLQNSTPMGCGAGPGLTPRSQGDTGGEMNVTLGVDQLPAHPHPMNGVDATATEHTANGNLLADTSTSVEVYQPPPGGSNFTAMAQSSIQVAGGSQPHNNMQPYLGLTFIIAMQGIFPTRP